MKARRISATGRRLSLLSEAMSSQGHQKHEPEEEGACGDESAVEDEIGLLRQDRRNDQGRNPEQWAGKQDCNAPSLRGRTKCNEASVGVAHRTASAVSLRNAHLASDLELSPATSAAGPRNAPLLPHHRPCEPAGRVVSCSWWSRWESGFRDETGCAAGPDGTGARGDTALLAGSVVPPEVIGSSRRPRRGALGVDVLGPPRERAGGS